MPNGPGKYDDICTMARKEANGKGALLIVIEGKEGSGFSAQLPADILQTVPSMLRNVADEIERTNNMAS